MALDDIPQPPPQGAPASTTEATNARMLTEVIGKLVEAGSSSTTAVITVLNAIATAITNSLIGGTTGTTADRLLRAKGTGGFALQNSPVGCDDSGNLTGIADLDASGTITADAGVFTTSLTVGGVDAAIVNQTPQLPTFWLFPEDGTFRVLIKSVFAWTITEVTTRTGAGTSTVTVSINGTPLGGSSNSASTSEQSQAHASANVVAVGDDIEVTFASTSSDCANLSLNITGTMVLAS